VGSGQFYLTIPYFFAKVWKKVAKNGQKKWPKAHFF
jgi:hypothetical protein